MKKKNLVWSTALQRSISAIAIGLTGLFVIVERILENTIWRQSHYRTSKYIVVAVGLLLIALLNYIYNKKGRYQWICNKGFKINKKTGAYSSVLIIFLSAVGYLIAYIAFTIAHR